MVEVTSVWLVNNLKTVSGNSIRIPPIESSISRLLTTEIRFGPKASRTRKLFLLFLLLI